MSGDEASLHDRLRDAWADVVDRLNDAQDPAEIVSLTTARNQLRAQVDSAALGALDDVSAAVAAVTAALRDVMTTAHTDPVQQFVDTIQAHVAKLSAISPGVAASPVGKEQAMTDAAVPIPVPSRISAADVEAEAQKLGCDPPAIWAVCDVESSGSWFLHDGRPKILFEAHIFGRLTHHQYDRSHPDISAPAWNHALYGAGGAHQYDRLNEAFSLDKTAALESASWGLFQIMGFNYGQCGFASAEDFVVAMRTTERAHLDAFLGFCRGAGLVAFLKSHDWVRFALGYNGPGEAKNNYHNKLAQAYKQRGG